MVHSALKRKRSVPEQSSFSLGLTINPKASYIAPNAVFITTLPSPKEAEASTRTTISSSPPSPPIEHPSYLSHLPPPPTHDPFPAVRSMFDLMSPLEFANLLRKRVKRLLSEWPPTIPSPSADGLLSPTLSSSSNQIRSESRSISIAALHAFVSFWRTEEFRTASTGVSIEELHTHLVALQTLLSFISCQELRKLIHSRLQVNSETNRERWAAVQGMLEVMKYTCAEDEPEEVLSSLTQIEEMKKTNFTVTRVEVGVNAVDEVENGQRPRPSNAGDDERPRKRPKLRIHGSQHSIPQTPTPEADVRPPTPTTGTLPAAASSATRAPEQIKPLTNVNMPKPSTTIPPTSKPISRQVPPAANAQNRTFVPTKMTQTRITDAQQPISSPVTHVSHPPSTSTAPAPPSNTTSPTDSDKAMPSSSVSSASTQGSQLRVEAHDGGDDDKDGDGDTDMEIDSDDEKNADGLIEVRNPEPARDSLLDGEKRANTQGAGHPRDAQPTQNEATPAITSHPAPHAPTTSSTTIAQSSSMSNHSAETPGTWLSLINRPAGSVQSSSRTTSTAVTPGTSRHSIKASGSLNPFYSSAAQLKYPPPPPQTLPPSPELPPPSPLEPPPPPPPPPPSTAWKPISMTSSTKRSQQSVPEMVHFDDAIDVQASSSIPRASVPPTTQLPSTTPTSRYRAAAPTFVRAQQPQAAFQSAESWVEGSKQPSKSTSAPVAPQDASSDASQSSQQATLSSELTVQVKREMINHWEAAYVIDQMDALDQAARGSASRPVGNFHHHGTPTGPRALGSLPGPPPSRPPINAPLGPRAITGAPPSARPPFQSAPPTPRQPAFARMEGAQQMRSLPPPTAPGMRSMFVAPGVVPFPPHVPSLPPLRPEGPELPPRPASLSRSDVPRNDAPLLSPPMRPRLMDSWRPSTEPRRGRSRSRSTSRSSSFRSKSRSRSSSSERRYRGARSPSVSSSKGKGAARRRSGIQSVPMGRSRPRSRSRSRSRSSSRGRNSSRRPIPYRKREYSYSRPPSPSIHKQYWSPGREDNASGSGAGKPDEGSQHSSRQTRSISPPRSNRPMTNRPPDYWPPRRDNDAGGSADHWGGRQQTSLMARPMAGGPIQKRGGPMRQR
ncbi:hypothetical protein M422DRAFT_248779 [Sphaerobolus stellatus SS14]|nr:hypothetical protein M422DRAFT_248779 [Sphaerobolus stellatus SS14]